MKEDSYLHHKANIAFFSLTGREEKIKNNVQLLSHSNNLDKAYYGIYSLVLTQ